MIKQKTYSAYHMNPDLCNLFIDEFLVKNGFTLVTTTYGGHQVDRYSYLQITTLIYEDNSKSRVFDNEYDILRVRNNKLEDFEIRNPPILTEDEIKNLPIENLCPDCKKRSNAKTPYGGKRCAICESYMIKVMNDC